MLTGVEKMINDLLGLTILYVIVYEIQSYTKKKTPTL